LRNLAVAVGNSGRADDLPLLEKTTQDDELLVREHVEWAIQKIKGKK